MARGLTKHLAALLSVALGAIAAAAPAVAQEARLRVIIETDAGGDPDDEQSLVRFLLYVNEWDVEGIIANRPVARPGENQNPVRDGLGIVRRHLDAYGEVYDRLRLHRPDYPTKQALWDRTVAGYADRDDAVDLIIAAVDRADPRPVWFQNWGTDHGSDPSNLKRALDKVLAERGPDGYARFKDKLRLSSDDQFGDHTGKLAPAWRLWVDTSHPRLDGAAWYHRFSPITSRAGGFDLRRDVREGHGPLGALYPTNTNLPQKEGDSLYFLYLIPTGMNDPAHPGWGSWAGRFGVREELSPTYYWANVRDTLGGSTSRDHTLSRWAADLQNDFRARLDWCVKPYEAANHPPNAVLQGDPSKSILELAVKAGEPMTLSGEGSTDPDGHPLTYEWIAYPEAGTYDGVVPLEDSTSDRVQVQAPADATGKEIHVILILRDQGNPPLAAYRRAVLRVSP